MRLSIYNQRLRAIEKRTRRFMLGAVAVLLLALVMIGVKQDYFQRRTSIYFVTSNAQGLSKGMAVKFIGFKVGAVDDISMQPNATVRVKLSLDDDYVPLIGQDAKARLVKEGLVGESVVEIIPGSKQVRHVTQNSVLQFERAQDVSTVVENLAEQLQPILSDVRQITSSINNPDGDVQQTLKNLSQATSGLDRKLNGVYTKFDQALDHANSTLGTLDKAMPKLVGKTDATLDNVLSASSDIKKITSQSAEQVPSLLHNTNALVEEGHETLTGVKSAWPLNGLFPSPQEQTLPADAYVPPGKP